MLFVVDHANNPGILILSILLKFDFMVTGV